MKEAFTNIIVVSNERWGDMWFSKQHYAHELALKGYTVYFHNPPQKWSLKNRSRKPEIKPVSENLFELNTFNPLPIFEIPPLSRSNDRFRLTQFRKLGLTPDNTLIWNFDPNRYSDCGKYKSIYHATDSFHSFKLDARNAKNAAVVVCTSTFFLEKYQALNENCIFIPHGISTNQPEINEELMSSLSEKYAPYFIMAGTFSKSTNVALLLKIAVSYPKFNFIFLGICAIDSEPNWLELLRQSNVHFLGVVKALELHNYIKPAIAGLTIYNFNYSQTNNGNAGSSLKNMNYLMQQKPIISTLSNDLDDFKNQGVYEGTSDQEVLSLVERATNGQLAPAPMKALGDFLSQHNYSLFIEKILNQLN